MVQKIFKFLVTLVKIFLIFFNKTLLYFRAIVLKIQFRTVLESPLKFSKNMFLEWYQNLEIQKKKFFLEQKKLNKPLFTSKSLLPLFVSTSKIGLLSQPSGPIPVPIISSLLFTTCICSSSSSSQQPSFKYRRDQATIYTSPHSHLLQGIPQLYDTKYKQVMPKSTS